MVFSPVHRDSLCDDPNLDNLVWMTQARKLKYYKIFISYPSRLLYSNTCILILIVYFKCTTIIIECNIL